MKKYIWITIVWLSLILWNCESAWDKYFEGNQEESTISSDLNLMEYLKTQDEYSVFVNLLEETGIDDELIRDQVLTVWVPANDILASQITELDSLSKIRLVRNHINNVALYTSKLSQKSALTTLEGKILPLNRSKDNYMIDGHTVVKADQICKNGVVHSIDGILIPIKNIYEYIEDAGEEYSMFRDSLFSYNDTIFRPDLSFPTGVDEVGNTIYDSIFMIENDYFRRGDIRNETGSFTLFLPSNKVMSEMIGNVAEYFKGINKEMLLSDTLFITSWILRSVLHEGQISNYEAFRDRYSIWNEKWRTDKQLVETNYIKCSNGYIYNLTSLRLPMLTYMEKVVVWPHYAMQIPEDRRGEYIHAYKYISMTDNNWNESDVENKWSLYLNICADTEESRNQHTDSYLAFKTFARDIYGNLDTVKIMPGIYKLSASYRAYANRGVTLYINNDSITVFNPGLSASGGSPRRGKYEYIPLEDAGNEDIERNGLILNNLVIKEEYGFNAVEIKLVNTGIPGEAVGYRMTPQYFVLEPTEDNY